MNIFNVVAFVIAGIGAIIGIALTGHVNSVRWSVKTLGDNFDVPTQAISTSIAEQRVLISPVVDESTPRLASERNLYVLRGRLIEAKIETDGDYHLVLEDTSTGLDIVAEIPNGDPPTPAQFRNQFLVARHTIDGIIGLLGSMPTRPANPPFVEVTGIGFFDEPHIIVPQGMAPNNREIHPVFTVRQITAK